MTDLSAEFKALAEYRPTHKVRFVTAASLFDGHDAAINIMRRILQGMGCRSDPPRPQPLGRRGRHRRAAGGRAGHRGVSSYQGGHVEYFKYMVDLLRQRGGAHVQVFGGGGGVIVPAEIRELQDYGVARIYSPEDGQRMGLAGMIGEMVMRCDVDLTPHARRSRTWPSCTGPHRAAAWRALAQADHRARERPRRPRGLQGRAGRCTARRRRRSPCSASPAPAAPARAASPTS
jgi:methylmalonyl-CoA mutase